MSDTGTGAALQRLLAVMARLRDPAHGCPWDLRQDLASIAPHAIEEAYELAAAIDAGEPAAIRDELGDVLFQVVILTRLAAERGWFGFAEVASAIADKLERRHPHVFGIEAGVVPRDPNSLSRSWELSKQRERAARGAGGVLADVPLALPALTRAAKLGRRAAAVGFDWPEPGGARDKLNEELAELDAALESGDTVARADELGDVLFCVVNVARLNGISPEEALRAANRKFERRFAAMEQLAAGDGKSLQALDFAAWDHYWLAAKRLSPGSGGGG
jgi:nucleoside triphosphate diphosphatase